MKKIDLITYHSVCNYGAVLQAYASQKFLMDLGFDVEIIDYSPEYINNYGSLRNSLKLTDVDNKSFLKKLIIAVIKTPSYKKQLKVFNKFIKNNMKLSQKYRNYDELINNPPKADFYCTGSDQVWNNYFSKGFVDAFFLDFVEKGKKKFSFAASFGKSEFDDDEKKYLSDKLKQYDFITVRETTGLNILNDINVTKSSDIMLDPTLCLDENIWSDFASERKYNFPYVLVYQLHGDDDTFERAIKFAKEKNLKVVKIVTMYHNLRCNCINELLPSVENFMSLFKYADYVFTDSFHGTVFSLTFKKKLGIVLPKKFNGRITSLLSQIEMENYILKDNEYDVDSKISNENVLTAFNSLKKLRKSNIDNFKSKISRLVK